MTARTLPLPGEFDNMFTPVIIRGQRRLKLIISCGHIFDPICNAASSI